MVTEGTIAQEQIDAWKKEYGHVYSTMVGDEAYIWRALRRNEYIEIMTQAFEDDVTPRERIFIRQEDMLRKCILYPDAKMMEKTIDEQGAFATAFADEIMAKSGFNIQETTEL